MASFNGWRLPNPEGTKTNSVALDRWRGCSEKRSLFRSGGKVAKWMERFFRPSVDHPVTANILSLGFDEAGEDVQDLLMVGLTSAVLAARWGHG